MGLFARLLYTDEYVMNVLDYGADSTGASESTDAFQELIDDAVASGSGVCHVYVPYGIGGRYFVRGLNVSDLDELVIIGDEGRWPTLVMTAMNDASTLARWITCTDVKKVRLENLKFDGNRANVTSSNPASNSQPIHVEWTVASVAEEDLEAHFENLQLTEGTGYPVGTGFIHVKAYESSTASYVSADRVTFRNIDVNQWGMRACLSVRGAVKNVYAKHITARNDGLYGNVACSDPAETYSPALWSVTAEVTWAHPVENVEIKDVYGFRCGGMFHQLVRNLTIEDVLFEQPYINPYWDTTSVIDSVDTGADTISTTIPSNGLSLPSGDYGDESHVHFTTTGTLPAGLVTDKIYYVVDVPSANTIKVSNKPSGTAIDITDSGTGTHTVNWLGMTYNTVSKEDDCDYFPANPGKHILKRYRVVDQAPSSRPYSVEVRLSGGSSSRKQAGVTFDECVFPGNVSCLSCYPGERNLYRNCEAYLPTELLGLSYEVNTSALIAGRNIDQEYNKIRDLADQSVILDDVCKITGNRYDRGVEIAFDTTGNNTGKLIFTDCVFNVTDVTNTFISMTPPASGEYEIHFIRCSVPVDNVNGCNFRVLSGGDPSTLTFFFQECRGLDIDALGVGQTASTRVVSTNNQDMLRANTKHPLITLTDSATPSIKGVTTAVTGGATAITNFSNGVDYDEFDLYIASGHQVNNTATIVNRSGANIAGPMTTKYRRYGGVWYEV